MTKKVSSWHVANAYLESIKLNYHTADFGYSAWNPPNTTLTISQKLVPLLIEQPSGLISFYWQCVAKLKRNHDPAYAVLVYLHADEFPLMNKSLLYRYLRRLIELKLLIKALDYHYLVNPDYCHKLYKPKFEIDE